MTEPFLEKSVHGKTEIPKELSDKRRKVGDCDFACPECGRHHHRVLWEYAMDFSFDEKKRKWEIEWGSSAITAVIECPCGKVWLVGETDYEGTTELFDLTPKPKIPEQTEASIK